MVKFSAISFKFCLIFSFSSDHFLLFILASVAANHKIVTESELLNDIAGVIKYAHDKIGAGVVERQQCMRLNIWIFVIWTTYIKMVHTMAPSSNFALTFPINIQLSRVQQVSLKPVYTKVYCATSVFIRENLMRTYKRSCYNFMIRYN